MFFLLSFSATAYNFALLTMAVELQDYEPTPLSDRAPLRDAGYQPQAPAVQPVEWVKMQRNKLNSALAFDKKFGRQLPVSWPYNADGTCIFYAYRLLDEQHRNDLKFHGVDPAISHLVQKEKPVNFHLPGFKVLCLEQIDKSSEGKFAKRPFLSASWELSSVVTLAHAKCNHDKSVQFEDCIFLRIDLIAMWNDGLFTETSFLDLSTEAKFDDFFQDSREVTDLLVVPEKTLR